jgi:hypothetical protein
MPDEAGHDRRVAVVTGGAGAIGGAIAAPRRRAARRAAGAGAYSSALASPRWGLAAVGAGPCVAQ